MNTSSSKNFAYIDGANLDKGTTESGWRIDYVKFYIWLKDKYKIDCAYIFIGYLGQYEKLYSKMHNAGFILVFKETMVSEGKVKGNCDVDLVVRAVRDVYEHSVGIVLLVSGDGDFASLIHFLKEKLIEIRIISPKNYCSHLLRKTHAPLSYLSDEKMKLQLVPIAPNTPHNEKDPGGDGTPQGPFS